MRCVYLNELFCLANQRCFASWMLYQLTFSNGLFSSFNFISRFSFPPSQLPTSRFSWSLLFSFAETLSQSLRDMVYFFLSHDVFLSSHALFSLLMIYFSPLMIYFSPLMSHDLFSSFQQSQRHDFFLSFSWFISRFAWFISRFAWFISRFAWFISLSSPSHDLFSSFSETLKAMI